MDPSAIIQVIVDALEHVKITRFAQLGSSCIIIFDHLITLDDEINLIWPSSWSFGKVLFLLNRYYSLAAVIFNNYGFFAPKLSDTNFVPLLSCLRFFQWQGWTGLVGCMLAEAILQMRLYALFSLDKRVLAFMLSLFLVSIATSAYIMGTVLSKITATAVSLPTGGMFCVPVGISPNFYLFWVPLLAYESLLCGLALFRGFQTLRAGGSLFYSGRQLVVILIRDSVLYFLVICATYLSALLVFLFAPVTLLEVPIGFTIAMSCVLANRVVLNVREVGQEIVTTSSTKPMTGRGGYDTSFCSPGTLTQIEMEQLRGMRTERELSDIIDDYDYEAHKEPKVPWVVL